MQVIEDGGRDDLKTGQFIFESAGEIIMQVIEGGGRDDIKVETKAGSEIDNLIVILNITDLRIKSEDGTPIKAENGSDILNEGYE